MKKKQNKTITISKTKIWVSFYYMVNRKVSGNPIDGFLNTVFEGSENNNLNSIESIRICEKKLKQMIAKDFNLPIEIITVSIINWRRLER